MERREQQLCDFEQDLREKEKSRNTIEKYVRDVRRFFSYMGEKELERERVIEYKAYLKDNYRLSSANSMLIALNAFLRFIGRTECCVRIYRTQRQIFREESKELNREDYKKLVREAKRRGNQRLYYLLQTLGTTGIRVSELSSITVEGLKKQSVRIHSKGKERVVLLPQSLVVLLRVYCSLNRIRQGAIFVTKAGKPVDRRNVWAEMKKLCAGAGVEESKVFPHNLRHLFARCYYEKEKDLVRLADYVIIRERGLLSVRMAGFFVAKKENI